MFAFFFIQNLNECLGAFDIEVSVVIPEDAIDDRAFFKYEAYYRFLKNVVVWAHIPNMSHATCGFDSGSFEPWFEWLKRKPLSVATKSLLSLSLAPLRYSILPNQAGPQLLPQAVFGEAAKGPLRAGGQPYID
ncbi:hypothetical protein MTO96_049350 [Rhipicephalus appendiculatus]